MVIDVSFNLVISQELQTHKPPMPVALLFCLIEFSSNIMLYIFSFKFYVNFRNSNRRKHFYLRSGANTKKFEGSVPVGM